MAKPPARGGARSAGGPTLGQATGGKPGKVKPAAPVKKSLGLGLGLNAKQRGGFQQAVQGGQGGQWLGNHPGVQQRIGQINPNSAQGGMQQARIQNFMGTGQSQRPQPPTQQQPPRGAQQMGPQPQAPLQMPQQPAPMQGYTGDNAGQQQNLAQMAGQMGQIDQGYGQGGYGYGGQRGQNPYGNMQPMQQQAPNWGGGMGYQGAIGGAGWMQPPTQQQQNPQTQRMPQSNQQGWGQGNQQTFGTQYGGFQQPYAGSDFTSRTTSPMGVGYGGGTGAGMSNLSGPYQGGPR